MAYTRAYTTWFDYPTTSTPITATSLQTIENGISGLSVGSTTFDLISLTSGTTAANGIIFGGVGGDTNLYRSAASTLKTDGGFVVGANLTLPGATSMINITALTAATQIVLRSRQSGDTNFRFAATGDGTLNWGVGGATATDTTLYRTAASTLKSDGSLELGGGGGGTLKVIPGGVTETSLGRWGPGSQAAVFFGTDTPLYRIAAGQLGISATLPSLSLFSSGAHQWDLTTATSISTADRFRLAVDSTTLLGVNTTGQLLFGTAEDTNLYRSAASTLKTDGTFNAVGGLQINGVAVSAGSSVPPGVITEYAGASAPTDWLLCDGSSVLRATYAALFAAIGTAYGSVDGTHFTLPDLQGRVPVGKGTNASVNALNLNDGQTVANRRPQHRTSLTDPGHAHNITTQIFSAGGSTVLQLNTNVSTTTQSTSSNTTGVTVGSGVANDALDAPSYVVVNYIIKT